MRLHPRCAAGEAAEAHRHAECALLVAAGGGSRAVWPDGLLLAARLHAHYADRPPGSGGGWLGVGELRGAANATSADRSRVAARAEALRSFLRGATAGGTGEEEHGEGVGAGGGPSAAACRRVVGQLEANALSVGSDAGPAGSGLFSHGP
jgi:hypothetical protein